MARIYGHLVVGNPAIRETNQSSIALRQPDFSVFLSGLDDFKNAARTSTASTEFVYLAHGDTYTFKPNV